AKDIEDLKIRQNHLLTRINNINNKDVDNVTYCINKFDVFLHNQSIEYKREFLSSIVNEIIWNPELNTINIIFKNL
ncbi:MAG: hypothetical protein ACRC3Y_13575, partial [Romboutsia sp.]|uniref:hypothetical protein n=1 Tax=Romboutsia sp. TaxID=1965302 RepID=UPI003F3926C0